MFPNWNGTLIAVSASFHSIAILSTLFRLWYRWYTNHLWWDDGWAGVALLGDIASLVVTLIQQPIPNSPLPRFLTAGIWIVSFAYPTTMWATRISILVSMVRVSRPEGTLRYVALGTGIFFGLMGLALLGERLHGCIVNQCYMTRELLITQTITDCVADVLLSALPIWFLRSVKLNRKRKILICSALSASMVINIVTITQAIVFFQSLTSGSIVYEHVKAACSMMVCNLLVIVTFVYRIVHRGEAGFEDSIPDTGRIEFTTVDFAQGGFSQGLTSKGMSSSAPTTKSSSWSFRAGRSKTSTSGTVGASLIREEPRSWVTSPIVHGHRASSPLQLSDQNTKGRMVPQVPRMHSCDRT